MALTIYKNGHKIMYKRCFFLVLSCCLSGCMGTLLQEGEGKYIDAEFPDIRSVPCREIAAASRTPCEKEEDPQDLQKLENDLKKIKTRDEALREKAFGS